MTVDLGSSPHPRAAAAGRTCVHCGEPRLDAHQPPEHPIPLALGSKITTYTTCADCQPLLSSEFESAWLADVFVQVARAENPVRNSRTKRGRGTSPFARGVDAAVSRHVVHPDGHTVVMRHGRPFYPGSMVQLPDGRVSVMASDPGRLRELVEQLKAAAGLQGKNLEALGAIERVTPSLADLELSDELAERSMFLGVRMGAKMALSFAAEVLPEEWRSSPYAERLRAWMWSERPTNEQGREIAWMPNHETEHPLDAPGKHFAYLQTLSSGELAVMVRVFSALGFTVPVDGSIEGRISQAWISGPGHSGPVTTTFDELVFAAARRSPHWQEPDPSEPIDDTPSPYVGEG